MATPPPTDPTPPEPPTQGWRLGHTIGLLILTLVIFAACYRVDARLYLWWGVMVLLGLAALLVGHGITGRLSGILIDAQNRMSLSRFQLVLWTVLIVSALLVLFFWRLRSGEPDPLKVEIPDQIWGLLGISSATLAGSSLIKTNKKNQTRNMEEEEVTAGRMRARGQDPEGARVTGRQVLNVSADRASWGDLFRGEESGNAASVSVGKFQMFYFTLIAVVTYGSALAQMFDGRTLPAGFPELSSGLLGLLAISHGGYLADKAVPHTQDPAAPGTTVPDPAQSPAPAPFPGGNVTPRRTARPLGRP